MVLLPMDALQVAPGGKHKTRIRTILPIQSITKAILKRHLFLFAFHKILCHSQILRSQQEKTNKSIESSKIIINFNPKYEFKANAF